MATQRERLEWARQARIVTAVDKLIERDDNSDPAALDDEDRECVRVVVRITAEADAVFRSIIRRDGPIPWNDRVDHLCDSIEAGIEFFATVKQSARVIRGVDLPRAMTSSLRRLMVEHTKLFRALQAPEHGLPRRLSILLGLIRIELIFFAHVW